MYITKLLYSIFIKDATEHSVELIVGKLITYQECRKVMSSTSYTFENNNTKNI